MKKVVAVLVFVCFFFVGNVHSQLNCDVDNGDQKFFMSFEPDKTSCLVLCGDDTVSISKIHQLGLYYLSDCNRIMIWIVDYHSDYIGQPIFLIDGDGSQKIGFIVEEFLLWKGEEPKIFSDVKAVCFYFEDGTFLVFGPDGDVVYSSEGMADEIIEEMKKVKK